jgi:long-chain acyl-CoA synthetase
LRRGASTKARRGPPRYAGRSRLADEIAKRAEAVLGTTVRQGYGMTEATFTTLNAPPDARVFGSVGKPVWGVEVRVADAQGRDVPPGQDGEVLVRGHNVMSHYLFDPDATHEAKTHGFFRSGDVGRFDAEGRLYIVDRVKDLVIRGGYNVYPSEVEDVLCAHPDVAEAAVIGRPDAFYGEEVVAVIVPRLPGSAPTIASLASFAAARLSPIKCPREYAFVDALPLGPSGKVQKRTLRERVENATLRPESVRESVRESARDVAPESASKNDT